MRAEAVRASTFWCIRVKSWGRLGPRRQELTLHTGEWDRPAFMPVTPQVRTPPRPLVLNEEPKMASILSFRTWVTSSRHRLVMAVGQREGGEGEGEGIRGAQAIARSCGRICAVQ